ncbi:hypothetical protein K435DRAFT_852529 [Dendrothele bispora CBS 962.96]|uniref:Uncharacterized protein n=1 Tax=Dendrothele bispora (strain CBS 962.96) TaxID=1314807 RepID=A0A4S8MJG6_DENBC|nr:hypothetical protein K435DRAFT_852529 [Dendrothele bispora CBS 962.96]
MRITLRDLEPSKSLRYSAYTIWPSYPLSHAKGLDGYFETADGDVSTMSSIPPVSASNSQAVSNLSSHISTSAPSASTPTPTPSAALSGGSGRYGKAAGGCGDSHTETQRKEIRLEILMPSVASPSPKPIPLASSGTRLTNTYSQHHHQNATDFL